MEIYQYILYTQFGFIPIIFVSICLLLISIVYNTVAFRIFMARIGFRSLCSPRTFLRLGFFRLVNDRIVGSVWFIGQNYKTLCIVSFVISLIALLRALYNMQALEFARGGALVAVAGLISLLIGLKEQKNIKLTWNKDILLNSINMNAKEQQELDDIASDHVDKSIRKATIISVFVSALGTFIWAYGDQMLACSVFPAFELNDKSGVACMKTLQQLRDNAPVDCWQKPETFVQKISCLKP